MEFSSQSSHLNLDKIIRSRTDRIVSLRIDLFISREELEDEILEGERVRENGGYGTLCRCTHLAPGGTEGKVILGTGCLIRLARENRVRRGRDPVARFSPTVARTLVRSSTEITLALFRFPPVEPALRGNRVGLISRDPSPRPWNIATPSFRSFDSNLSNRNFR